MLQSLCGDDPPYKHQEVCYLVTMATSIIKMFVDLGPEQVKDSLEHARGQLLTMQARNEQYKFLSFYLQNIGKIQVGD